MKGRIISINISQKKGVSKKPIKEAFLKKDHGILGDAHAGPWHRQVSLLSWHHVKEFIQKNQSVQRLRPGDFAENLTVDIDLSSLRVGDLLKIGKGVIIRVTQIGKECHSGCNIYREVGDCLMPRKGIFAEVVNEGKIQTGDEIKLIGR